jgi:hypothetical protein
VRLFLDKVWRDSEKNEEEEKGGDEERGEEREELEKIWGEEDEVREVERV